MERADEKIQQHNELTQQIEQIVKEILLKKEKNDAEEKKEAADKSKKRNNIVLTIVSIIQIIGIILTIKNGGNLPLVLLIMMVTNSLSQMGIDFYTGDKKPHFSAGLRAIPIFVAVSAYLTTLHIV